MSEESSSGAYFRENSRAPLEAPAEIQLDTFSDPLTGQTANVSQGGMFIKAKQPPPVGSLVRFKVQLGLPASTVQGTGEVVWIRASSDGPVRPAGFGIQFRYVEEEGALLLRTAVQQALETLGPEPDPPPRPRPKPPRPVLPEEAADRRSKSRANTKAKSKPREKKLKPKGGTTDEKKILGLPPEKAKLVFLLILITILAVAFLL